MVNVDDYFVNQEDVEKLEQRLELERQEEVYHNLQCLLESEVFRWVLPSERVFISNFIQMSRNCRSLLKLSLDF